MEKKKKLQNECNDAMGEMLKINLKVIKKFGSETAFV